MSAKSEEALRSLVYRLNAKTGDRLATTLAQAGDATDVAVGAGTEAVLAALAAHIAAGPIDHPDGSVTIEKLAFDVATQDELDDATAMLLASLADYVPLDGSVAMTGALTTPNITVVGDILLDDGFGLSSHTVGTSPAYFTFSPDDSYISTDSFVEMLGGLFAASISTGSGYFSGAVTVNGALGVSASGVGGDGSPLLTPIFYAGSPANSSKWVGIGYDNTGDFGFLYAAHHSTAWKNLVIAPYGGVVVIGKRTTSRSAGDLDVAGNVYAANVYAANIPSGTLAVLGSAQTFTQPQTFVITDAATATINSSLNLVHNSTATPAAGFGSRLGFQAKSSTTNSQAVAAVDGVWRDAIHATQTGALELGAYYVGSLQQGLRIDANAAGVRLGFYNVAAVARQTVTGSRGGNAALASLLTALANLGLIIDSTTV